ncbi:MAG: HAD family hydrolase, partial [Planctomycetota bacterium]
MDLPAPRLIALDLDGTLITPDNRIPRAHRDALARLEELGVAVAIVTGRPVLSTRPIHRALGLHGPVVCFNGVWAGDPNGPAIHSDMLDADEVAGILP